MSHPSLLAAADFNYHLPEEKIAFRPTEKRDDSRLLVYHKGNITDSTFLNLPAQLPPRSLLIFNDTKVVEARLIFKKDSGSTIEIFCLAPGEEYPDITTGLAQHGTVKWQCLVGGASKWKPGQILEKKVSAGNGDFTLQASMHRKESGFFLIDFHWQPSDFSFAEVLHFCGAMPLPPYIRRQADIADAERYQTVFARREGSVAAPTASLHFSTEVLSSLEKQGIKSSYLTLHVGAGTFKPVKSETMAGHMMHSEYFDVPKATIEALLQQATYPVIPVGTTALRTIESLYWLGAHLSRKNEKVKTIPAISQWDPYDHPADISKTAALQALLNWMQEENKERVTGQTQLLIAPGYSFRIADALITNFHQPQSTLLLLVAALAGPDWKKIYEHALASDYRFLSYGDSSLLWRREMK